MAASEIVHGLHLKKKNYKNKHGDSTLELKNKKKKESVKVHCLWLDHSLRACDGFKKMSVTEQWKVAKQGKLCYRCLPNNQFDSGCTRTRIPYSL